MYLRFLKFIFPTRPPYFKSDATRHCGSNMAEDELVRIEINIATSIKVAHAGNGDFIESNDAHYHITRRCVLQFDVINNQMVSNISTTQLKFRHLTRTETFLYNLKQVTYNREVGKKKFVYSYAKLPPFTQFNIVSSLNDIPCSSTLTSILFKDCTITCFFPIIIIIQKMKFI